jgi:hypothetical protein
VLVAQDLRIALGQRREHLLGAREPARALEHDVGRRARERELPHGLHVLALEAPARVLEREQLHDALAQDLRHELVESLRAGEDAVLDERAAHVAPRARDELGHGVLRQQAPPDEQPLELLLGRVAPAVEDLALVEEDLGAHRRGDGEHAVRAIEHEVAHDLRQRRLAQRPAHARALIRTRRAAGSRGSPRPGA